MRQRGISYDDCRNRYHIGCSTTTLIMKRFKESGKDLNTLKQMPAEEKHYGSDAVSMVVERIPGEKVYIDRIGGQPEILVNPTTGETKKVHFFVTTVGVSSLVYAEAFEDEKLPNFIAGTVHALEAYGAVPKYLVPDNLKTAVTKHTRDEPVINSAYQDLEVLGFVRINLGFLFGMDYHRFVIDLFYLQPKITSI